MDHTLYKVSEATPLKSMILIFSTEVFSYFYVRSVNNTCTFLQSCKIEYIAKKIACYVAFVTQCTLTLAQESPTSFFLKKAITSKILIADTIKSL